MSISSSDQSPDSAADQQTGVSPLKSFHCLQENVSNSEKIGLLVHDEEGKIFYTNQHLCDIINLSQEAIQSLNLFSTDWKMVFPDGSPVMGRQDFPSAMSQRSGLAIRNILRGIFANDPDRLRWLLFDVEPVAIQDDQTNHYYCVLVRDVTSRFRSVPDTPDMDKEALFETVLRAAPVGIGFIRDQVLGWTNWTLQKMVGYSAEEMQNQSARMLYPSDDEFEYVAGTRHPRLARSGIGAIETCFKHKSGHLLDVIVSSVPVTPGDLSNGMIFTVQDVTEKKWAESRLRQSQEQFRLAFDQSSVGMAIIKPDGKFLDVNTRQCSITGYDRNSLLEMTCWDISHADDVQDIKYAFQSLIEGTQTAVELRHRYIRPDESIVWVVLNMSLVCNENRIPMYYIMQVRDITEQVQAEKQLAQHEQQLANLFANLPGMAFRCLNDEDWTMEFLSEGCRRVTGYDPEVFVSKDRTYLDIIHPDDREHVQDVIQLSVLEKTNYQITYRIINAKGEERWMWEQGCGIYSEDGQVEALEGYIADMTDRHLAEEALRESEERFHSLGDNVENGFFFELVRYEPEAIRIRYCSRGIETVLGISPDEAVRDSQQILSLFNEEDLKEFERKQIDSLQTGESINMEIVAALPDEQERWIYIICVPRWIDQGASVWDGIALDVTEKHFEADRRLDLEAQLRESQKMEAVGQLAGGIAHDFNNLLTAIFAHVELLQDMIPDNVEANESLDQLAEAAEQAAGVTRALLTFSKKLPMAKKNIDMSTVVKDTFRLLRRVLPAGIEIKINADEQQPLIVQADHTQLQQVIMNLAINARDAMPDGGQLRVSTWARTDAINGDPVVDIEVADTGVGMSKQVQEHIFEPFFTTKSEGKGTGLGLSIVHGIVEDHDGIIQVWSSPGQGTAFTITLPRVTDVQPDPEAQVRRRWSQGHEELIVLAEDDDHIREVVASSLASRNYEVIQTRDGAGFLEAMNKLDREPSLLILDLEMPKVDGLTCLEKLRKQGVQTPTILITAWVDTELEDRLDDETNILRKPFRLAELANLVKHYCLRKDTSGDEQDGSSDTDE